MNSLACLIIEFLVQYYNVLLCIKEVLLYIIILFACL